MSYRLSIDYMLITNSNVAVRVLSDMSQIGASING